MRYICLILSTLIMFSSCAHQAYNEFGKDLKKIEIQTRENARALDEIESKMSQLPDSTFQLMQYVRELQEDIIGLRENLKKISDDVKELNFTLMSIEGKTGHMAYRDPDYTGEQTDITRQPLQQGSQTTIIDQDTDIKKPEQRPRELPPVPVTGQKPGIPELQKRYNSAYSDYIASIYSIAIAGFESFINDAQGISELEYLVVDSYFWLGDCYMLKKEYNRAAQYMEMYVSEAKRTRPRENKLPDAYFRIIQIYSELGLVKEARKYRSILNEEFPLHNKTREANQLNM